MGKLAEIAPDKSVPFLFSKEDGGVVSEFAVKQSDSENFSDIGEQEGDKRCAGSSPLLTLDAIFEQFVELSQNPSLNNLNYLDNLARYAVYLYCMMVIVSELCRLVFKNCDYNPLHGVKFFREILCKYHREWIIPRRTPKYPPFSEVSMDICSLPEYRCYFFFFYS